MSRNIRSLSSRKELDDNLFHRLQQAVENTGAAEAELRTLAEERQLTPAVTYGSASFYDYLTGENENRRAWPCRAIRLVLGQDGGGGGRGRAGAA